MKIHGNARTCPNSRRLLVRRIEEEGWSLMAAAEAAGISERSARKWRDRWRQEELKLLGIEMIRITAPRLKREPQAVLRNLAALLERRGQELAGLAVPRQLP